MPDPCSCGAFKALQKERELRKELEVNGRAPELARQLVTLQKALSRAKGRVSSLEALIERARSRPVGAVMLLAEDVRLAVSRMDQATYAARRKAPGRSEGQ